MLQKKLEALTENNMKDTDNIIYACIYYAQIKRHIIYTLNFPLSVIKATTDQEAVEQSDSCTNLEARLSGSQFSILNVPAI